MTENIIFDFLLIVAIYAIWHFIDEFFFSKTIFTRVIKRKRENIGLKLRYEILRRDNFKCSKCGDSPAINQSCNLHIDHIVPFSKGGMTNKENLQVLCQDCNLGKSNYYF